MILALLLMVAMPMMAERVSPETARKVATTFLNNNGAKSAQLTDLSKAAGFANLYIFNGEEGFVVMAADDCVRPILGYSLTDKFVTEGMPENLKWWLQGYDDQIQDIKDKKLAADVSASIEWQKWENGVSAKDAPTVIVSPLTATLWDQTYPYNFYCPSCNGGSGNHVYTGCVATAMAQLMKYWNYPTAGNGSHTYTHPTYGEQSANFGATSYDWDNMPNSLYSNSSQTQINAVATLMYHCGVAVEMNYGSGSSGANSGNVAPAMIDYFRYSPSATFVARSAYSDEQWKAFLKNELDEGRPLYYSGNNTNSGHAFVCDGYRSDDFFHFNWGWSGYDGNYGSAHGNNGYWAIGSLSPGAGGSGSGSGTYNLNNAVVAWLEPVSTVSAPILTAEANNGIITLSWNVTEGVNSYDIYRDNAKIATRIESNSFIDNTVIPDTYYQYYVRAVNGETRSNPSNRITISTFYRDYAPSGLTANLDDNSVTLDWIAPDNNNGTLQYSTSFSSTRYGMGENKDCYWTEVFDPSRLADFEGMYIHKISTYLYLPGNYTLFIYKDNAEDETNKLYEESFNIPSFGHGWKDIELSTPVLLDCTKELWVIMFYPYTEGSQQTYWYPATCGPYDEILYDDPENEERHNPRLLGETLGEWYYVGDNISWIIRTYLTDGTYTYNLYDGTTQLASNITETNYTVSNVANNATHQYTVKTNYYGGESAASNVAGLTFGTASLSSLELGENDKMTVTEGSELTVSGTLSDINEGNLILENGAELVHNSDNVKATVKKTITPPSNDDHGWYFIASPVTEDVTPTADNGFLNGDAQSNTYDLYYYDEPTHYWKNYEKSAFNLLPQKGYLYANEATNGTTLQFTGTLTPSNSSVTINGLSHIASSLNGFNLVGNPFACNATVNKDFYVVDNTTGKVILASNRSEIAPCAGIFVKATANDASVTFTKAASRVEPSSSSFDIVVKREAQPTRDGVSAGSTTLDRARVRLGDAETLEKFSIGDGEGSVIYFPQNGQDLAVACANGESEMPLNFKAAKNGTYTLAFEVENLDLDYLHLIDNMTGNEVDVMAMPTYTFEAKTSDYASRFRLVFSMLADGPSADEQPFAYYANGEIRLVETCHGASLQVVDMTGRVVLTGDAMNRVSTNGMTAGVYVLRLINGNDVKTQKIVIE